MALPRGIIEFLAMNLFNCQQEGIVLAGLHIAFFEPAAL
jgi:hypothetical protein